MNFEPGLLLERICAAKLSLDPEDIQSIRHDLALLETMSGQRNIKQDQELARATEVLKERTNKVEEALLKSRLLSHLMTTLIDSCQ
jgi:hypothetical protein